MVMGIQSSAWIFLGKVQNPMTGKLDKDLGQANIAIDTLAMLKDRTRGNLKPEEDKYLSQALAQLQLNYLDEVGKDESKR